MCRDVPGLNADEITALRRAAAMAHTVAGIGITLRAGERVLATVVPSSERHSSPSVPAVQMNACTFRNAVAKAWTDHSAGQRVALLGHSACGLDVEWALHQPGAMLGFGGVRTQWAGRMVWAMASTLPPDVLTTVLDAAGDHSIEVWVARVSPLETVAPQTPNETVAAQTAQRPGDPSQTTRFSSKQPPTARRSTRRAPVSASRSTGFRRWHGR